LPTLSLRARRDTVLAGEPGCVCDPELFTGPADTEPENEPPEDRAIRIAVAREVCASCPVRLVSCPTFSGQGILRLFTRLPAFPAARP
jgi:hypothetical protein